MQNQLKLLLQQHFVSVFTEHSHIVHQGYILRSPAGYTWTNKDFSDDRGLEAGGSVSGTAPNVAVLREIRVQTMNQPSKE